MAQSHRRSQLALFGVAVVGMLAVGALSLRAQHEQVATDPGVINACVDTHTGELFLASPELGCRKRSRPLAWNITGPQGPAGPQGADGPIGPAGAAGALTITYESGFMVPDTSVARAFCPAGTRVLGGGGASSSGAPLQQTYPISDHTGVIAWGTNAIGWQVAAADWSDVTAYVVCAGAQN